MSANCPALEDQRSVSPRSRGRSLIHELVECDSQALEPRAYLSLLGRFHYLYQYCTKYRTPHPGPIINKSCSIILTTTVGIFISSLPNPDTWIILKTICTTFCTRNVSGMFPQLLQSAVCTTTETGKMLYGTDILYKYSLFFFNYRQ